MFVVLTFLFTTALYGGLLWLGGRRVAAHLRGNPAAARAVSDHLLLPLLRGKPRGPDNAPETADL
jgi:hypothetical protein